MAQNNQSLASRVGNYQPSKSTLGWSCAATAVATMIIGFSWGGWVTGGTSRAEAATAGDVARGELASLICIQNFKADLDSAAHLIELKSLAGDYKKRQFVEAGGWATMPGEETPNKRAADICAQSLAT